MSENNRASVYVHINLVNGKKYFGITSQNPPENRWRNGNGYINNTHFSSAVKKYGWKNFAHLILYRDIPIKIAKNIEEMLIQEHMSYDPRFGYNKTMGGELERHTKEGRQKMSEVKKELYTKYPEKNPMYGKHHSENAREAMSKAKKELYKNHPELKPIPPKPVMAINAKTGLPSLYFESASSAERLGFDTGHISECCNGKRKTHKCYIWRFTEGGERK